MNRDSDKEPVKCLLKGESVSGQVIVFYVSLLGLQ